MNKLILAVFLLAFFQVNAQRFPPDAPRPQPRPLPNRDFTECFNSVSSLEPSLITVLEGVESGEKENMVQILKDFISQFKLAATACGIDIPEAQFRGDSARCEQDVTFLTSVLKEVKNQAAKPSEEQNIIAIVTTFMGLANQLPRTVQDCSV